MLPAGGQQLGGCTEGCSDPGRQVVESLRFGAQDLTGDRLPVHRPSLSLSQPPRTNPG